MAWKRSGVQFPLAPPRTGCRDAKGRTFPVALRLWLSSHAREAVRWNDAGRGLILVVEVREEGTNEFTGEAFVAVL